VEDTLENPVTNRVPKVQGSANAAAESLRQKDRMQNRRFIFAALGVNNLLHGAELTLTLFISSELSGNLPAAFLVGRRQKILFFRRKSWT